MALNTTKLVKFIFTQNFHDNNEANTSVYQASRCLHQFYIYPSKTCQNIMTSLMQIYLLEVLCVPLSK